MEKNMENDLEIGIISLIIGIRGTLLGAPRKKKDYSRLGCMLGPPF